MDNKMNDKTQEKIQEKKETPAEKPVSLWGAPFNDVINALLDTKPMAKKEESKKDSRL